MDVDHRLKLLIRLLLYHAIARVAGVVDDDVQPAEAVERRLHETFAEVGRGDFADACHRLAARRLDGRDRLRRRILVEVVDDHACPLGGQLERHRATDAAARARNDCDLAPYSTHRSLPCPWRSRRWLRSEEPT